MSLDPFVVLEMTPITSLTRDGAHGSTRETSKTSLNQVPHPPPVLVLLRPLNARSAAGVHKVSSMPLTQLHISISISCHDGEFARSIRDRCFVSLSVSALGCLGKSVLHKSVCLGVNRCCN